jgi:hypothetical protein
MSALLKTTNNFLFIVDDDWAPLVRNHTWCASGAKKSKKKYVTAKLYVDKKTETFLLHRLIVGALRGETVDHINGNSFDNRRANLRVATHQENLFNRGARKDSESGLKCVFYDKSRGKWAVRIKTKQQGRFFKRYPTKEVAIAEYNRIAREWHGEFAFLHA